MDPIGNLLLVTNKLKLSAVTIPLLLALGLHALMKFKKLLQLEPVATAMIRNGVRWENGPIWKPRVSFGNLVFYVKPYIFAVYGRSRYIYIYIDSGDIKQLISGGAGRLMDRDRWLKGR